MAMATERSLSALYETFDELTTAVIAAARTFAAIVRRMEDKGLEAEYWGQRIRMFRLVPSLVLHLIRRPQDREWLTSEGLPADVNFVAATYDEAQRVLRVYVASETFDPVPEGQAVPEIDVVFTVHYPDPASQED